eukprot:1175424-Prorocentrum_minimum.AAC.7
MDASRSSICSQRQPAFRTASFSILTTAPGAALTTSAPAPPEPPPPTSSVPGSPAQSPSHVQSRVGRAVIARDGTLAGMVGSAGRT